MKKKGYAWRAAKWTDRPCQYKGCGKGRQSPLYCHQHGLLVARLRAEEYALNDITWKEIAYE